MASDSQGIFAHLFENAPDDWEIIALPDVVDFQEGPGILAKDFHDNGVPLLRLSSISGPITTFEGCNYLDPEKVEKKWGHFRLKEKDILLSTSGSLGRVSEVAPQQEGSICYTGIIRFRPRSNRILYSYIKYFLQSEQFKLQADSSASGSVLSHFGPTHLKKMSFPLPPIAHQMFIEKLISPIDDKIQLNHKTNQTLEQIAQAIFKSWFVDFEPVKAKIAARQRWLAMQPGNESASPVCYAGELNPDAPRHDLETTMTLAAMQAISGKDEQTLIRLQTEQPEQYAELCTTAELFPSAMQDSELGEIPKDWDVSEIGKEVEVVGGGTPSTKNPDFWQGGHLHWTTPKDLSNITDNVLVDTERKITEAGLAKISSGLLPVDTVLMSSRAPVGYLALAKVPVAVNQGYIAMKSNKRLSPEYVIQWCESRMDEIKSRASGTTFAEISKKNFKVISILVPGLSILEKYSEQIKTIYSEIENSVRQNSTLTQIRDTLLPRLLSGELDILDKVDKVRTDEGATA